MTAVVGLTSAGTDFDGGLFMSNVARRVFLPLRAGDAVVHSSDLFHGVHVRGAGERWSLIVWFRTCPQCTMAGADGWFRERAFAGEPIAQYLLGRRLGQERRHHKCHVDCSTDGHILCHIATPIVPPSGLSHRLWHPLLSSPGRSTATASAKASRAAARPRRRRGGGRRASAGSMPPR